MKKTVVVAFAGALSFFSALPVLAHHSSSMFDPVKTITLRGVVKEFQYTNPHAWLVVEVPGSGGKVATWAFEMGELSGLTRTGIYKRDFLPGTKVTITGRPMKDGRTAAIFTKAVRADGEVFTPQGHHHQSNN
jgi:hypothetical protein